MKSDRLAVAIVVVSFFFVRSGFALDIQIRWGIRPAWEPSVGCNDTRLFDGEVEMGVDRFNDRYELCLGYVEDGSFDDTNGFASLQWLSSCQAVKRSERYPGSTIMLGECVITGNDLFPVTTLGDIEEIDPEGEIDEDEFYHGRWMDGYFAIFVREKKTGTTLWLSETMDGSGRVMPILLDGSFTMTPSILYPDANIFRFFVTNAQQRVYLGAPLPARCVWMADRGLTTADLEGVSERRIALATALGKTPDEVADVTLRIDGFDPETGTVSYGFDAEAPDGTTSAVTKLWYGAELRLLGGTELGTWTETNVVDVTTAGGRVAVPTGGDARFYRLELAVP